MPESLVRRVANPLDDQCAEDSARDALGDTASRRPDASSLAVLRARTGHRARVGARGAGGVEVCGHGNARRWLGDVTELLDRRLVAWEMIPERQIGHNHAVDGAKGDEACHSVVVITTATTTEWQTVPPAPGRCTRDWLLPASAASAVQPVAQVGPASLGRHEIAIEWKSDHESAAQRPPASDPAHGTSMSSRRSSSNTSLACFRNSAPRMYSLNSDASIFPRKMSVAANRCRLSRGSISTRRDDGTIRVFGESGPSVSLGVGDTSGDNDPWRSRPAAAPGSIGHGDAQRSAWPTTQGGPRRDSRPGQGDARQRR